MDSERRLSKDVSTFACLSDWSFTFAWNISSSLRLSLLKSMDMFGWVSININILAWMWKKTHTQVCLWECACFVAINLDLVSLWVMLCEPVGFVFTCLCSFDLFVSLWSYLSIALLVHFFVWLPLRRSKSSHTHIQARLCSGGEKRKVVTRPRSTTLKAILQMKAKGEQLMSIRY